MRITKDNRKIKYLYHYTKNENVDKILASGKITSSDQYTFFTDSYYKSLALFEDEMVSNNLYYDLDLKLKRRNYAKAEDYKIIKIPYYNDGKFVNIGFKDSSKDNIYSRSVIHAGEVYFDRKKAKVLEIPTIKERMPKAFKFIFSKLVYLAMFFAPMKVSADTWLDNESYRDTSWFDEDTYDTTSNYTINSAAKMAGLLYEVNIKGYTFSGKTIKIYAPGAGRYCTNTTCRIDMTAHDWVPLKSTFAGVFDTRHEENGIHCGMHRVVLRAINNVPTYTESGSCQYMTWDSSRNPIQQEVSPCAAFTYSIQYTISTNTPDNGTIVAPAYSQSGQTITINLNPQQGYYIDKLVVKKANGEKIDVTRYYSNTYRFTMPASAVEIEVTYKTATELNDVTPATHSASEDGKCTIISGNGKKIGSEIECAGERFYVLKSDGNTVKLLSKYNLLIGESIFKEKNSKVENDSRNNNDYCLDLAYEKGGSYRNDNFYNAPGYCFIVKQYTTTNNLLQHEKALSAHWDENNNYLYPQVGDIYITAQSQNGSQSPAFYDLKVDQQSSSKYEGYFYDLNIGNGPVSQYLAAYKTSLQNLGFTVNLVDLMTLEDISDAIIENGKTIPYLEWYNHTREISPPFYDFASLKDFLSDNEAFMYGTTYWIRSGYELANNQIGINNLIFVDTHGGVCSSGVVTGTYTGYNCQSYIKLTTTLGAGVRPAVVMPLSNIKFNIKTETDGKGSIRVVDSASGGETITFEILTNEGYVLDSLTIKKDDEETVTFTEKDITKNEDGTITISSNDFTMPNDNVTIIANWKTEIDEIAEDNPKTVDNIIIYGVTFMISLILVMAIKVRRKMEI